MIPPILLLFGLLGGGATNGPVIFLYVDVLPDASPEASYLSYPPEASVLPLDVLVSAPGSLP